MVAKHAEDRGVIPSKSSPSDDGKPGSMGCRIANEAYPRPVGEADSL